MKERMELPDGWVETIVKTVAKNIQYGYTESSSKEDIGPKFLRITDIQDNKVDWQHVPYCKINEIDKANYLLSDGDLVFARTGATVGKSFLIKGNIPEAIFASYLIRLRFSKDILDKYVWYYFQSPLYWNQIINKQVGTGQPNVNGTTLAALSIGIPPLPEQHRIVAAIEALFTSLDRGIASLKTAQQQLKIYRQAVLKWAFEGKLTNEGVKEGELPEGWKWVKVGDVVKKMDQGWSPKCENERSISNEEWAVIKTTAIQHNLFIETANKKLPLDLKPRTQHELQKNDILITRAGPRVRVGVCCLVKNVRPKLLNCDKAYRIKVTEEVITPGFLVQVLNSPQFLEILEVCKSGGNDSGLNLTQNVFLDISIPLPISIEEQESIVAAIESRLSVCDKLEETILQSLQQAEALRQSILKKAFAGQLVPQDPNDEPASVLLERIRAERASSSNPKEHRSNKRKPKSQ